MNKVDDEKNVEGLQGRYVYILSPVRNVTPDQAKIIAEHAKKLKEAGAILFNPVDNAPQQDATGYNIVMSELNFLYEAAKNGGRVDILWNAGGTPSEGSRVDVGMAIALGLELNLVKVFNVDKVAGPQMCFELIENRNAPEVIDALLVMLRKREVVIDWDIEMQTAEQEWQRVCLGMALGIMMEDPEFKIKLGKVVGIDPPEIKSYVKVMKEIEARQVAR